MDMDTLSNLLKLTSKDSPSLNKQIKLINTMLRIKDKGLSSEDAICILSEINPKLSPLVSLFNGFNEKSKESKEKSSDFVQYNHF